MSTANPDLKRMELLHKSIQTVELNQTDDIALLSSTIQESNDRFLVSLSIIRLSKLLSIQKLHQILQNTLLNHEFSRIRHSQLLNFIISLIDQSASISDAYHLSDTLIKTLMSHTNNQSSILNIILNDLKRMNFKSFESLRRFFNYIFILLPYNPILHKYVDMISLQSKSTLSQIYIMLLYQSVSHELLFPILDCLSHQNDCFHEAMETILSKQYKNECLSDMICMMDSFLKHTSSKTDEIEFLMIMSNVILDKNNDIQDFIKISSCYRRLILKLLESKSTKLWKSVRIALNACILPLIVLESILKDTCYMSIRNDIFENSRQILNVKIH